MIIPTTPRATTLQEESGQHEEEFGNDGQQPVANRCCEHGGRTEGGLEEPQQDELPDP